jgi:hypothetical protein
MISVDLPPPDTPVMHVNVPSGISADTRLRLLPRAPVTFSALPLPGRRFAGTCICRIPTRYCPVTLSGLRITSSGVPSATISPP